MHVSVIIEDLFRVTCSEHPFSADVDLEAFRLSPRICHRDCPFDGTRQLRPMSSMCLDEKPLRPSSHTWGDADATNIALRVRGRTRANPICEWTPQCGGSAVRNAVAAR